MNDHAEVPRLRDELCALKEALAVAERRATQAEHRAALAEERATVAEAQAAKLALLLEKLKAETFGRKADKVDVRQLLLAFAQTNAEEPARPAFVDQAPDGEVVHARGGRRKARRLRLPENLPRERVVVEPRAADLVCSCGAVKKRIGEETSEHLHHVPSVLVIRETVRPKYACPNRCDGVVIAAPPAAVIEKGKPTAALLAEVVTQKYGDHLPLNRQRDMFARHGVEIPTSTLCDWVRAVAELLAPIVAFMLMRVRSGCYVQCDETPVRVAGVRPSTMHKGRIWVLRDPLEPGWTCFIATLTKEAKWPRAFLVGFAGYFQADAYSGFDGLFSDGKIKEIGCHAHARRKFVQAADAGSQPALWVVAGYRKLYEIERDANVGGLEAEARLALRQEKSKPLIESMFAYIDELDPPPSSLLGEAVRYATNQRAALLRFLEDGRLLLDNNGAERPLRQVAVGRKNWLFAGSPNGSEWAATLYTLVVSCKEIGLDPKLYFEYVLERIATTAQSRIFELTPVGVKARLPDPAPD